MSATDSSILGAEELETPYEDIPVEEAEEEAATTQAAELAEEPIFVWLLREAVAATASGDVVLRDFVKDVAGPLSEHLALVTAKGGQAFIAERLAEGKTAADVSRYQQQQSMRAHLVNGFLPAARVARTLAAWDAPRFRYWDETVYRLFSAGYMLHDWVKLPAVEAELAARGLRHDRANPAQHLPVFEELFRQWSATLGLDEFLGPIGGLDQWLHEVIYLAVNAQVRWGTMLNQAALPGLRLNGRARQLATDLCTLADRIAYIARTPVEAATNGQIAEPLRNLSDGAARLVYHHVAEVRGVLTNFIHNAALAAMQSDDCLPLLFAPSGVVYLTRGAPAFPDTTVVAEAVVERIRRACAGRIGNEFVGLKRDGKGLKAAAYYDLHLKPADQIRLIARGVFRRIPDDKKTFDSGKRYAKIADKGWLSPGRDLDLPADVRVDQLAEFCAFAVNIARAAAPDLDAEVLLLRELAIPDAGPAFDELRHADRTGGVSYHWYYAAGYFLRHGAGRGSDSAQWRERIETLAEALARAVERAETTAAGDGWDDARLYVRRVLSFGPAAGDGASVIKQTGHELVRYQNAKRQRKATTVCSLCSSDYTVKEQEEAGLLFMPQVYTNKQSLHSGKANRNICAICEMEMMLRQILMNRGGSAGRNFEGRRFRYLFFYPTYFFTPETMAQLNFLYNRLRNVSFTQLRKALLTDSGDTLRVDRATFQRLQEFMMTTDPPEEDRLFRMRFFEGDPITFSFLGLPPGRDAKDAEAWINPAWLALALPLALDVKMVATESPLPLLQEANELDEMIFLDAPHDYVAALVGRERIPLESLLLRLQTLTVAYMIHIDGNASFGKGLPDYRWHAIPLLARRLAENPLWAAAYLKKWQRAQKLDTIPTDRAHLYRQYIDVLEQAHSIQGGISMTHAQRLTELYRGFYRAQKWNSNSILRPITIASRAILDADPRLFADRDALTEAVLGELHTFMERVENNKADGRLPKGVAREEREAAMRAFAAYFVGDIYCDALNGDASALRGKQLNLLKNACEVIYRDEDARYWRERNMTPPTKSGEADN
jgi:CRISPR-associated protein Csc3